MSAVSEVKTVANIRDNMAAGLKVIQKEQLRIKKEIQETREVLKDTFGKKWSIKLESVELVQFMQEISKEIGLLRKQMTIIQEVYSSNSSKTNDPVNKSSAVAEQKYLYKDKNKYDINSNVDLSMINEVGDIVDTVVNESASGLFTKVAKALKKPIGVIGKIGSSLLGEAVSEEIKYIMKDMKDIESAGIVAEQQDAYMERAIRVSNPNMDINLVKKQRDEYMKSLRKNSEDAGFKPSEVFDVGESAVKAVGGDIDKAIELVRVAENMTALNAGSTLTEAMEAIMSAENGDLEGLRSFGAQVSSKDLSLGFDSIVNQKLKVQFAGGIEAHMSTLAGLQTAESAYRENQRQESGRVLLRSKEEKEIKDIKMARKYRAMDLNEKVMQFKDVDEQHKRISEKKTVDEKHKRISGKKPVTIKKRNSIWESWERNFPINKEEYHNYDSLGDGSGKIKLFGSKADVNTIKSPGNNQNYLKQSGGITGIGDIRDSIKHSIGNPIKIPDSQNKQKGILNNTLSLNRFFEIPQMLGISGSSQIAAAMMTPQNKQSNVTTVQSPNVTINFNGTNMSPKEITNEIVKNVKLAIGNMGSKPNTWLGGMPV